MYKCGWNGCEKAYGTLNHLNAHVTMQSHGTKRTPEGEIALSDICPASELGLALKWCLNRVYVVSQPVVWLALGAGARLQVFHA